MNITISPCPHDRLEQIIEASKNTAEEHRARQPYAFPENFWEFALQQEFLDAFVDAKGQPVKQSQNLLIAELEGALAGYILLPWHTRDDVEAFDYGVIYDIHVFEKFHGSAVGDALLEKAKSIADARGWDDLSATIWAGNAMSEELFRRAGFTDKQTVLRYGPTQQARPIVAATQKKTLLPSPWMIWCVIFLIAGLIAYLTR